MMEGFGVEFYMDQSKKNESTFLEKTGSLVLSHVKKLKTTTKKFRLDLNTSKRGCIFL